MRLTLALFVLSASFLFSQKIEGKFKLIQIDSTDNFYILKFASKSKIDSSNCFLITTGKNLTIGKRMKINKKYLLKVKTKFPYDLGIENISSWGVEDKTIWNKGNKCPVYSSESIDGLNYIK